MNNNDYVVTGEVHNIGEIQKISEKFQKREIVIKTEGDYPQLIACQLTQDKCQLGNYLSVGQKIDAHFNLRGREWTNQKGEVKYFNSIDIWRIDKDDNEQPKRDGIEQNFVEDQIQATHNDIADADDLPF